MIRKLSHTVNVLVCAVLMIQLVGCGTILYPERKGQRAGRIDVGVALLDGIGLLFFLIPGVIAYAVDFNNGTIYLPGTSRGSLELKDMKQVKFDPTQNSIASLERIIQKETGYEVKAYQDDMEIYKLKSVDEMMVCFAEALPATQDTASLY